MKIKIIGRRYSETATYYAWDYDKAFPRFEETSCQTWEIYGETLDDGRKWLAENHPDMYMGSNIICENGNFSCSAVPCFEYGFGNFETLAARVAFVKRIAKKLRRA